MLPFGQHVWLVHPAKQDCAIRHSKIPVVSCGWYDCGGCRRPGIYLPEDAPEWAQDRQELWSQAERAEERKDAQLARIYEAALPHELTDE